MLALAVYVAGFFLWYPRGLSVADEAHYVSGALAFVQAFTTGHLGEVDAAGRIGVAPTTYPAGTAMLQAPWVGVFGWRAAPVASLLAWLAVAGLLYGWLRAAGRDPRWAWLWVAYPPGLVAGRLAMSDVIGALVVTLALVLLWAVEQRPRPWWSVAGAGACLGGAVLLREPLLLVVVPFGLGACLRWRTNRAWLVIGGCLGLLARLATGAWWYGGPLTVNPVSFGFSADAVIRNLPIYLGLGVVGVPAGLVWAARYRGWRTVEVQTAVWVSVAFFACYGYSAQAAGFGPRVVLLGRFLLPIVPLLAWCAAWAAPAVSHGPWGERRFPGGLVQAAAAATLLGVFLVHPVASRWDRAQAAVMRMLEAATPPGARLISAAEADVRFLAPDGSRRLVAGEAVDRARLARWAAQGTPVFVLGVSRGPSDLQQEEWRMARELRAGLTALGCAVEPVRREAPAAGLLVELDRVGACRAEGADPGVSP